MSGPPARSRPQRHRRVSTATARTPRRHKRKDPRKNPVRAGYNLKEAYELGVFNVGRCDTKDKRCCGSVDFASKIAPNLTFFCRSPVFHTGVFSTKPNDSGPRKDSICSTYSARRCTHSRYRLTSEHPSSVAPNSKASRAAARG